MPPSAYDLTGRTAFVTGAGSGIGRACAVLRAEAGARVHRADRDADGLDGTAALIEDHGGTARAHVVDVTDRSGLAEAVRSCGRPDVLAAIAGITHSSPVLETRDEDPDRVLNVNFKDVLYACQEAARLMLAHGTRGSIVTTASGAVDTGGAGLLRYGAAKAAVIQPTRTPATGLGPHGVRVDAVAPGRIRTPMTARPGRAARAHSEAVTTRMTPLGRVGEPDDVAHTVLYLASDASAFTTGRTLRPNGGVTMPW
ncbi:SDR family NAD(P)-dependent oxidoreductase [Streptomyces eurythermus]|uniref:SDR family NAD(P)-dependent oxidoreductase n=1 Tax=Streptomyces eurythermus TaxID=42237 RepID=UPI0033CF5EBE